MPIIMLFLFIVLIIVGPLLTIWSLNTLFPVLAIDYNFYTWLAVIILAGALRTNVSVNK